MAISLRREKRLAGDDAIQLRCFGLQAGFRHGSFALNFRMIGTDFDLTLLK